MGRCYLGLILLMGVCGPNATDPATGNNFPRMAIGYRTTIALTASSRDVRAVQTISLNLSLVLNAVYFYSSRYGKASPQHWSAPLFLVYSAALLKNAHHDLVASSVSTSEK